MPFTGHNEADTRAKLIDPALHQAKAVMGHDARRTDTGRKAKADEVRDSYVARDYDARLQIPERVAAMCDDLFQYLLETGGPEQKTIVFCAADMHADRVAAHLNNRYAAWCRAEGRARAEPYAFKCTAASEGNRMIEDLRGTSSAWFVATTVDLLSTGVDVPCVRNIVFFRYLESSIVFHQMVGRGTRIDEASGKLMFRLCDYTNIIRLFGTAFVTPPPRTGGGGWGGGGDDDPEATIVTKGFAVEVTRGGHFVLGERDGALAPVAYAEYKAALAERLRQEAADLTEFRQRWIAPPEREDLMRALVDSSHSPKVVQMVDAMQDCDLFDVLAALGYGAKARTRIDRDSRAEDQGRAGHWACSARSALCCASRTTSSVGVARAGVPVAFPKSVSPAAGLPLVTPCPAFEPQPVQRSTTEGRPRTPAFTAASKSP